MMIIYHAEAFLKRKEKYIFLSLFERNTVDTDDKSPSLITVGHRDPISSPSPLILILVVTSTLSLSHTLALVLHIILVLDLNIYFFSITFSSPHIPSSP